MIYFELNFLRDVFKGLVLFTEGVELIIASLWEQSCVYHAFSLNWPIDDSAFQIQLPLLQLCFNCDSVSVYKETSTADVDGLLLFFEVDDFEVHFGVS